MTKQFSKGDIATIVETRVTPYVHGSRPAETSTTIRIVRIESASRDGATIKSYRTHPGSPVYKYDNHYARYRLMTIRGAMQANARRLFDAATAPLDYNSQESAQGAIIFAGA
jgi:hypothetical protein